MPGNLLRTSQILTLINVYTTPDNVVTCSVVYSVPLKVPPFFPFSPAKDEENIVSEWSQMHT